MIKGRLISIAMVLTFLTSGIAHCADGNIFPDSFFIKKNKVVESAEYSKAANISKQAENFLNTQYKDSESKSDLEKKKFSFVGVLLNMIKALVAIVVLILAITGLVMAFNKLRSKNQKQESRSQIINEPTNISEAVSSFVRHKLDQ